jgi:hypothetical protein
MKKLDIADDPWYRRARTSIKIVIGDGVVLIVFGVLTLPVYSAIGWELYGITVYVCGGMTGAGAALVCLGLIERRKLRDQRQKLRDMLATHRAR